MKLSSLSEILDCINYWQKISNNADEILKYLSNADSFSYCKKGCKKTDYLHVYPGVHPKTKIFYVFLISTENDKPQEDYKLYKSITQCIVKISTSNEIGSIPEKDAKERIENWNNDVIKWVKSQINTDSGIFKAFNMPASYMKQCKRYKTFFALKKTTDSSETEYDADLISIEHSIFRRVQIYYDFVRPVPPFGGGSAASSDFYLLSINTSQENR